MRKLDAVVPHQETLVIVTADHCEGLSEHDYMGHSPILYEETLRVPLLFRWTGRIPKGWTLSGPVGHVDLMPTILGLLGLDPDGALLDGRNLSASLLSGSPLPSDWPLFFQRRLYRTSRATSFRVEGVRFGKQLDIRGPKFTVLRGPWKYIVAYEEGTRELYSLDHDPGERNNVAEDHRKVVFELEELLYDWRREQSELAQAPSEASEEDLERLRSLGYVR